MLKLLIIDDEYDAYENVLFAIQKMKGIDIESLTYAPNVQAALPLIKEGNPDIILLDIEMPVENGFELFKYIDYHKYKIIFITAYDEFAIRAFDFNAIAYLLKPIAKDELQKALQKANTSLQNDHLLESVKQIQNKTLPDYIVLRVDDAYRKIYHDHILYIEARAMYAVLHIRTNHSTTQLMMSHPLSYYENLLPEKQFIRVHKTFLVQKNAVSGIENETLHLFDAGIRIPIAKRRLNYVVSAFRH